MKKYGRGFFYLSVTWIKLISVFHYFWYSAKVDVDLMCRPGWCHRQRWSQQLMTLSRHNWRRQCRVETIDVVNVVSTRLATQSRQNWCHRQLMISTRVTPSTVDIADRKTSSTTFPNAFGGFDIYIVQDYIKHPITFKYFTWKLL